MTDKILIGLILGAVSLFFTFLNGMIILFVFGWVKRVNTTLKELANAVVETRINNKAVEKEFELIRRDQKSGEIKISKLQDNQSKMWEILSVFSPKRDSDKILEVLQQAIKEDSK